MEAITIASPDVRSKFDGIVRDAKISVETAARHDIVKINVLGEITNDQIKAIQEIGEPTFKRSGPGMVIMIKIDRMI
jgi:hypothetical protein